MKDMSAEVDLQASADARAVDLAASLAPEPATAGAETEPVERVAPLRVVVTGLDIPFGVMVAVIFKATLAAVPALFLASIVLVLVQFAGCSMLASSGRW